MAAAGVAQPPPHQLSAHEWISLNTPPEELFLANTLVTGQSFRWRRSQDSSSPHETYVGVIGQRLVEMRQLPDNVQYRVLARSPSEDPAVDAAVIHDYFNLGTSLAQLSQHWAARDPRYALVAPALPGCRMLRQDPVECLFQFICSSNNHISRIHGMVERLCSTYGSPLVPQCADTAQQQPYQQQHQQPQSQQTVSLPQRGTADSPQLPLTPNTPAATANWAGMPVQQQQVQIGQQQSDLSSIPLPFQQQQQQEMVDTIGQAQQQHVQQWLGQSDQDLPSFFAFPTLEQLSAATEEALRADGFGYRAKYIVGSVQQLLEKPEGGVSWLLSLRDKPYAEAHEALCSLPGVGPKVAACICLFSLDKHDAIPVDTHVWNLATRYYAPHLAKKSLTPKLHAEVQAAFVDRFGPYAGWAHNCLFISELASHKPLLPARLSAAAVGGSATPGQSGQALKKRKASGGDAASAGVLGSAVVALDVTLGASVATTDSTDGVAVAVSAAGVLVEQDSNPAVRRRRRKPTSKQQLAGISTGIVGCASPLDPGSC